MHRTKVVARKTFMPMQPPMKPHLKLFSITSRSISRIEGHVFGVESPRTRPSDLITETRPPIRIQVSRCCPRCLPVFFTPFTLFPPRPSFPGYTQNFLIISPRHLQRSNWSLPPQIRNKAPNHLLLLRLSHSTPKHDGRFISCWKLKGSSL